MYENMIWVEVIKVNLYMYIKWFIKGMVLEVKINDEFFYYFICKVILKIVKDVINNYYFNFCWWIKKIKRYEYYIKFKFNERRYDDIGFRIKFMIYLVNDW